MRKRIDRKLVRVREMLISSKLMDDIKKWPSSLFWISLCTVYSYWTWTSQLNDFGGDSAVYLLTAQHWSPFTNQNPAASQFATASTYPPLYPLLLALFSAGDAWLVAHQVTAFCGVATLFVLWRCLRVSGLPMADSLIAVAVLATIPGFYLQALYIHSEFLFMFFVSICIYAVCLLEREAKPMYIVIASLAAAGAYLTRSVGLSIVAALVVYVVLNRPKKEWPVVLVLAVGPVGAWMLFGQSANGGYLTQWSARFWLAGSPEIATILMSQVASLVDGYTQNFAGPGFENRVGVLLFSVGCLVAWLFRLWQRKLDALFLGAYFAILLVWPFPAERVRFLLPAIPVLIVQMLLALHELKFSYAAHHSSVVVRVPLAVLAITSLPSLGLAVHRQLEPLPQEMESYRQSPEWHGEGGREARLAAIFQYQRWQAGYEQLKLHVPIADCVYSIKPSLVGLFAERSSYHSPLPNTSLGKILEPKAAKCRYVHMVAFVSPTYSEPYYPLSSWLDGIDLMHVTRFIVADENSTVVGLLAKIK